MEDSFNIFINVAQLLKETVGSRRHYLVEEIADPVNKQKLNGEVRLTRSQRGILIEGDLKTQIETLCSRCLSPIRLPLTFKIMKEEFLPRVHVISGSPLPVDEEAGTFIINEEHILDLGEVVRQYFILATPMKPLCQPDCAGLCSVCGANLNQGSCNCYSPN